MQWASKFQEVKFRWINRNANKVADCLAKRVEDDLDFRLHYYVPNYLSGLLHDDHIHSS